MSASLDEFQKRGAVRLSGAARDLLPILLDAVGKLPKDLPGIRIGAAAGLRELVADSGAIGSRILLFAGADARPVRMILFDKNPATNWALGWHQDRTICVQEQRDVAGFGPWTRKAGMLHVAPPIHLLEQMVTVRVHLDDVPIDNAPLLVAPGSHRFGLVREDAIADIVARCGVEACLADAGDIWVYATPILHASDAAANPRRRRVLQIDYAAFDLTDGLEWSGI